ncbi:hypothetical protein EfmAA94_16480 [Enterococcus faecium]|nr:hypothetical protein EfmAA94_16480 [Enterococcus faecium]
MTVPSTRSLEPVELPMDFSVDEVFMTEEQFQSRDEQMSADEILLIEGPLLNLAESIEDNILLAIPMRVLTKEEEAATELPKGNDWEVMIFYEEEFICQNNKSALSVWPLWVKI